MSELDDEDLTSLSEQYRRFSANHLSEGRGAVNR